jgi:hypothetical protein
VSEAQTCQKLMDVLLFKGRLNVRTSAAMQTSANITHWKIMKEFTTS